MKVNKILKRTSFLISKYSKQTSVVINYDKPNEKKYTDNYVKNIPKNFHE